MKRVLRPSLLRGFDLAQKNLVFRRWESNSVGPSVSGEPQGNKTARAVKTGRLTDRALANTSEKLSAKDKKRLFYFLSKSSYDTHWFVGAQKTSLCRQLCFSLDNAEASPHWPRRGNDYAIYNC